MQLRYNYRLYPTPGQRAALARLFGCVRVVYNDGLRARTQAHNAGLPYISDAELSARLTAAKATPERARLNEVSAVALQQSLADLSTAYKNFFASVKGPGWPARTPGSPRSGPTSTTRSSRRSSATAKQYTSRTCA